MNRNKTRVDVEVLEVNGDEPAAEGMVVSVRNHWNRDCLVILCLPNKTNLTVFADDLANAIRKCST